MTLIDTNVYSELRRGNQLVVSALQQSHSISIALMSIAELRYGFIKGSIADKNEAVLTAFLADSSVSVLIPGLQTTIEYAALALHAQKSGRSLSVNDLWIAALAREHDASLVTFDRDFRIFADMLGKGLVIL